MQYSPRFLALPLVLLAAAGLHCGNEAAPPAEKPAPTASAALAPSSSAPVVPAAFTEPAESARPQPIAQPSSSAAASAPKPPASAPDDMIEIPAGIFLMGSRIEQGSPEERPAHEVAVASFYLDKTEVTTEAYVACMTAGACSKPHTNHPLCNIKKPDERAKHPINCVDWNQAESYCKFAGKRLPTEREWEYAARGGSEQRRYSWGNDDAEIEKVACYKHPGSCPVGSFPPGAFGLLDMSGNVWEWTSSLFGNYPDEATKGSYRVYRGGSFSRRFPKWLSNAMRNRYLPTEQSASLGLRCAKSKLPLTCPADTEAKGEGCVRVRGTPLCEPTFAWNGESCSPGGVAAVRSSGGPSKKPETEAEAPKDAPPEPKATDPVARTRTPQHDPDCKTNWPKKPAAYRFSGATFHARNIPLEAAGCTRRDMGQTWTSACCPE
ncbi:MAG: formylglycine-generating enzyme family protein [Polyangiaceae bacterium]|nr:formylglycine-generating enzyme family protein [Polyangiaceae bacterium]